MKSLICIATVILSCSMAHPADYGDSPSSDCLNKCWDVYTQCRSKAAGQQSLCDPVKTACEENNKYCDDLAAKGQSKLEQKDFQQYMKNINFGSDSGSDSGASSGPITVFPTSDGGSDGSNDGDKKAEEEKPAEPITPALQKRTSSAVPDNLPDDFTATGTWYKKSIYAAQYPTTACGEGPDQWKSNVVLVAISENFFGVGDGGGAGLGCGKCYYVKPVGFVDREGVPELNPIKVKVVDLCPATGGAPSDTGGNNAEWCVAKTSERNSKGVSMHFDFMYESLDIEPKWKDAAYNEYMHEWTTSDILPATSKSSNYSIQNPPGYIKPLLQDMLLTDITAEQLFSDARLLGVEHFSPAAAFPGSFSVKGEAPASARWTLLRGQSKRTEGVRSSKV
ncbi:hypothetical protein MP638_002385 [Amoeboaphelidium occidentale]|nr:hypothetical protein MP638_002385 [Amoeboaphelidium occidentale]